jgi:hypothetical protein
MRAMPNSPLTHRNPGPRLWALLALTLSLAACNNEQANAQAAQQEAHAQKLAKAKAIFAERCKTAGVVIKRTVKDVEGIELTKIRPKLEFADRRYFDPMFEGAAMAGEYESDRYVWHFLASEFRNLNTPDARGQLNPPRSKLGPSERPPTQGYRFVEFFDEVSGKRQRCTRTDEPNPKAFEDLMRCEPAETSITRYALDYEDLVDPADRAYWVAGTKLRVIDKQSSEVIAELTRFVIDRGFGESSTGRWPWSHANSRASQRCPSDPSQPLHSDSRYFVDTVLIPKQGD